VYCFAIVDCSSCITVARRPCYGQLKINPSYTIVCYCVSIKFVYYGGLLTAINAIFAIIANGRQGIVDIDREVGRNKLITCLIHDIILNPSMAASANPFRGGSRGWSMLSRQNHAAGGANGSIMVGMYVFVCFAS
jgi:hypothetical protein